jgi:hypothetical protein
MRTVRLLLMWIFALSAIAAAILWYKSSVARVGEGDPAIKNDKWGSPEIYGEDKHGTYELVRTVALQSKWNRYAAIAAALSAATAGLSQFIPSDGASS